MIKFGDKHYFTHPNWKLGFFWSGNIRTAIASLRRTKWRSFFTMLGVVIGVTSVITFVSLGEGLKHQLTGNIDKMGNNVLTVWPGQLASRDKTGAIDHVNLLAFFNSSTLTDRDVQSINHQAFVDSVAPIDFVGSTAKGRLTASNLSVIATTPALSDILRLKTEFGAFIAPENTLAFAVLGPETALDLFQSRNPFADTVTINGHNFIVHGVLKKDSGGLFTLGQTDFNHTVFVPYATAKALAHGNVNLLQILVRVKPGTNLGKAAAALTRTLNKNHHGGDDFTVLKHSELLTVADQAVGNLTKFIGSVAAISLLVGGIGIMDIMLVAVSERTREIGVRKAIGATNRQILNQFLTEGLVLSVGGGVIGLAVAFIINLLLRLYSGLHPVIAWPVVALALIISVLVGIVFSGAPALKAARKLPIDALRGE